MEHLPPRLPEGLAGTGVCAVSRVKKEMTPEQKSFALVLKKALTLIETADALITDGDSLQSLKKEFGNDDHIYLWAKEARGFLRRLR